MNSAENKLNRSFRLARTSCRVALFDMDGTLVETDAANTAAYRTTLSKFGISLPYKLVDRITGADVCRYTPNLSTVDLAAIACAKKTAVIFSQGWSCLPKARPVEHMRRSTTTGCSSVSTRLSAMVVVATSTPISSPRMRWILPTALCGRTRIQKSSPPLRRASKSKTSERLPNYAAEYVCVCG